jgi:hypothetical protein
MMRARAWLRELGVVAASGFVSVVLTWPMVLNLDRPHSLRPDYFNNLWNIWWVRHAVLEHGSSPYWTDFLHYPWGIWLGRHTLSLMNALLGAVLGSAVESHAAFNLLVLGHFTLAAWAGFALVRYLTGSAAAGLLAGVLYSFSPFHYFYLPQINVFSTGLLPLAVLFALKVYRGEGRASLVGVTALTFLLTISSEYYLVYAVLLVAAAGVMGPLWAPDVRPSSGLARLSAAAVSSLAVVLLAGWPVLLSPAGATAVEPESVAHLVGRSNDLLGYNWVVPPERALVSWPTMLGYASMLILVVGWREVARQRFWLLAGGLFAILSLGPRLLIAGQDTGVPLPYALLVELPWLGMLRKADRFFGVVLLVAAVLVGFAAKSIAGRVGRPGRRRAVWSVMVLAVAAELSAIPWTSFDDERSSALEQLRGRGDVDAVVHLPVSRASLDQGVYDYAQTSHGKRMPLGMTTRLALTEDLLREERKWTEAYAALAGENDAEPLVERMCSRGIQVAILHKHTHRFRQPVRPRGRIVWTPFRFGGRELVRLRQIGPGERMATDARRLKAQRRALARHLGPPVLEDQQVIVFRLARCPRP